MPKVKTHSASKKRFDITGSGKIKRAKAYKSHILTKKTSKRKRSLRQSSTASKADTRSIKTLIPYK